MVSSREIFSKKKPLDRLSFTCGEVLSVGIKKDDVCEILVKRGFPDVDAALFLSTFKLMTDYGELAVILLQKKASRQT